MRGTPAIGTIAWTDLTVKNAEEVRDFYRDVAGWRTSPVDMGGYDDFNMYPPGERDPVAGVCHARESNADLPPHWLLYVIVDDLDVRLARCRERGGSVAAGPRPLSGGRFAVVRDPAGAVLALYEPATDQTGAQEGGETS